VSTIIPVFNRPDLVRDAVASVLAQSYRPVEVILVDDGSTDDTPEVLQGLAGQHPGVVKVVRQPNRGVGLAREAGRTVASGEFIQYLDSDDVLHPLKFARQVAALRQTPHADVSYCFTRYCPAGSPALEKPWKGSGVTVDSMFPSFLNERWWDTPTPLYRRSICDLAGPWTDLRLEEDWEYDCRIASFGARLVHCPQFLVDVRDHSGDRLCRGESFNPSRNRDRARARILIHQHASRSRVPISNEHMQRFARSLFLLARQCGASGLPRESRELFHLARHVSGQQRARGFDFCTYRLGTLILGWCAMGRLCCWCDDRCRLASFRMRNRS
jgi:glycosyltransferase involved in cell wall biosynthesis